jgi:membrane protein involved in colicin uptake
MQGVAEKIARQKKNSEVAAAYRALLDCGAFSTAEERAARAAARASRAQAKAAREKEAVARARAKAEKRRAELDEAQLAANTARRRDGVVAGPTRTGWHDLRSDGTSMNVGNSLADRPAVRLHPEYNAGTAMVQALSEPH